MYSEIDVNSASSRTRNPYYYAKRASESFAESFLSKLERKIELTVLVVAIPIGPLLLPRVAPSTRSLLEMMGGVARSVPHVGFGFVDVRDVAQAVDLVMARPECAGERYIVSQGSYWMGDLVTMMKESFPDYPFPELKLPGFLGKVTALLAAAGDPFLTVDFIKTHYGRRPMYNSSKIEALGFEAQVPMQITLFDMGQSFIDHKLIDPWHPEHGSEK